MQFSQVDATTPGPPTGDEVQGGFPSTISFDLASGALLGASYLRIENLETEVQNGQLGGVPIDAIGAVPEPATGLMLSLGLLGVARGRRAQTRW